MRKKLLDFMQGRFGILWYMAILLPLLVVVTSFSQYLYAENSTATVKALVVEVVARLGLLAAVEVALGDIDTRLRFR